MSLREVRRIHAKEATAYEDLLLRSHAESQGFFIHPSSARWDSNDDRNFPLGVFESGKLISCMRLDWITQLKDLEARLDLKLPTSKLELPCGYLTKAGTDPKFRNLGYNALLRYHFLKIAKKYKVQSLFGTMVEGSPRVFSMKEMGYTFQKLSKKWDNAFVSDHLPLVAHLDLHRKADFAIDYIARQIPKLLADYPAAYQIEEFQLPYKA